MEDGEEEEKEEKALRVKQRRDRWIEMMYDLWLYLINFHSIIEKLRDLGYTYKELASDEDESDWHWSDIIDKPGKLTKKGELFEKCLNS